MTLKSKYNLTAAQRDKLPKARLRYGYRPGDYYECAYLHGDKDIDVPWAMDDFKPNGVGLPTVCGGSNATIRFSRSKDNTFDHPVLAVYTIDSATYIVIQVDRDRKPLLAVRYRHVKGAIIDVYDRSNDKPDYKPILRAMLDDNPYFSLRKSRRDPRPAGEAHGKGGGHGPSKRRGLVGYARRFARAGFIDRETMNRVEADAEKMAARR